MRRRLRLNSDCLYIPHIAVLHPRLQPLVDMPKVRPSGRTLPTRKTSDEGGRVRLNWITCSDDADAEIGTLRALARDSQVEAERQVAAAEDRVAMAETAAADAERRAADEKERREKAEKLAEAYKLVLGDHGVSFDGLKQRAAGAPHEKTLAPASESEA